MSDVPEGVVLKKKGRLNGEFDFGDIATAGGEPVLLEFEVPPVAMTFEEFYAGFTPDSSPAFSIKPTAGQMDRRNGAPTKFVVSCNPNGVGGIHVGMLCVVLPDDNSQFNFAIAANAI